MMKASARCLSSYSLQLCFSFQSFKPNKMLLYNLSTGETLGVSAGKLWTRIVMFEGSGRQIFVEKFYTPIININHVRQYLMQLTIDTNEPNDEVICERIIRQILKVTEQL